MRTVKLSEWELYTIVESTLRDSSMVSDSLSEASSKSSQESMPSKTESSGVETANPIFTSTNSRRRFDRSGHGKWDL